MTVWIHDRRGRIEGDVVWQDETWAHIALTTDSPWPSTKERGHGPVDKAGETIAVRRAFLTEIIRPTVAELLDFARRHPGRHTSATDMDIRNELRITPSRYLQLLLDAVQAPEALQIDPQTTRRLIRETDRAAEARARRLHP